MKGPNPFTYWDYRAGMFHQDMGMRIDLVYATAAVADRVTDAYIDREARKGKGPVRPRAGRRRYRHLIARSVARPLARPYR